MTGPKWPQEIAVTSMQLFRAVALLCTGLLLNWAVAADLNTAAIERLTGLKGTLNEKEGEFKVNFPRKDIAAKVAGVKMIPDLGLTAWEAFTRAGEHPMVMGNIVLLENEVSPVMSAALDSGLEVTALHNHFLWESPRVMFMHITGTGNEMTLAEAVGRVFGKLKEVMQSRTSSVMADVDPAKTSFDTAHLEQILGTAGAFK